MSFLFIIHRVRCRAKYPPRNESANQLCARSIPRLSRMLYPYAIFRIADFVTSTKSPFHAVLSKMYACEAQVLIRSIAIRFKNKVVPSHEKTPKPMSKCSNKLFRRQWK